MPFLPIFCSCELSVSSLVSLLVFPRPLHQEPLKVIKKCPPGERFNTLQVNSPARDPHPILFHLILSQIGVPFSIRFSLKRLCC